MTPLPPFAIERYFAVHEFAVPYLLCASDVEPLSMGELLAHSDDETRELWDGLDGRFRLGFGRANLPEALERLDRHLRA